MMLAQLASAGTLAGLTHFIPGGMAKSQDELFRMGLPSVKGVAILPHQYR